MRVCNHIPTRVCFIQFPDKVFAFIIDFIAQRKRATFQRVVPHTTSCIQRIVLGQLLILPEFTRTIFIPPIEYLVAIPCNRGHIHRRKRKHLPAIRRNRRYYRIDRNFSTEFLFHTGLVFESHDHPVVTRLLHAENKGCIKAHGNRITKYRLSDNRILYNIDNLHLCRDLAPNFEIASSKAQHEHAAGTIQASPRKIKLCLVFPAKVSLESHIIQNLRHVVTHMEYRVNIAITHHHQRI